MTPGEQDSLDHRKTDNKVENTVKHQVTKKKCPKIYRIIFFWVSIIVSISFLVTAIPDGVIQIVTIVVVWSVCLFLLRNFAYKDLYSRPMMLSVVITTIIISFVTISFETEQSPLVQQQNQQEITEETARAERDARDTRDTIAKHEYEKEKSTALLEKIKSQNSTVPFGEIEDQPFAEWHGKNGEVLFRGGEQIKTDVAFNTELQAIEQLLSSEGFETNKHNEGSLVGGIGYKGFESDDIGCTITTSHYADEKKDETEITITCWDLE